MMPSPARPLDAQQNAGAAGFIPWLIWPARAATLAALYAWLLGCGAHGFRPVQYGLTFNSMLTHMLHGRFDVDPSAISWEGFRRGDAVYSYFGPFCAAVRLLFMPFVDIRVVDVTGWSMWLAVSTAGVLKALSIRVVWRNVPPSHLRELLAACLVAAMLFAGSQVQFLAPSIYQEVISWADAEASGFVLLAIVGLLRQHFSTKLLAGQAVLAGLALLTRVSTGLELYVALGLLLPVTAPAAREGGPWAPSRLARLVLRPQNLVAGGILVGFAAIMATVNIGRWGNPLIFANFNLYTFNAAFVDRLPRLHHYGEFNLLRLPFGLVYYFFPVWFLPDGGGMILGAMRQRLLDAAEFPPSSFLLSDPLLLALGVIGLRRLVWRRRPTSLDRSTVLVLMVGLTITPLLMLTAISMTFRYRMEFYPLFEFAALIGMFVLCEHGEERRPRLLVAASAVSVAMAVVLLIAYKLVVFGPVTEPWGVQHLRCPPPICSAARPAD